MAHELAHLKNGDTTMKAIALMYRTILPFDPLIRLVEAAINREREYLADETAAVVTGKPWALASALLKIHESLSNVSTKGLSTLVIIGDGRGILSRHPPLERRIERLLRMTESKDV